MFNFLTFDVHHVVWLMDAMADEMLAKNFGINFSRFFILVTLSNIQPTTQADLAVCVGHSPAAISKSLRSLKADGYVLVVSDPAHGRKNRVTLSEAGEKLVAESSAFLEQEFISMLQDSNIDVAEYAKSTAAVRESLIKRGY